MKRIVCLLLAAAVLLLPACSAAQETGSYLSAQADKTYQGTVSALSLEFLVVSTEDGDVQILYTADTVFTGFDSPGGGFGRSGGAGEAPPELETSGTPANPGSDAECGTDGEMPLEPLDTAAPADNGNSAESAPAQPSGQEDTIQDLDGGQQSASTFEDVSLNDEVTVVTGEDGTAETVTRSESAGSAPPSAPAESDGEGTSSSNA